jgi:hypothetical protein
MLPHGGFLHGCGHAPFAAQSSGTGLLQAGSALPGGHGCGVVHAGSDEPGAHAGAGGKHAESAEPGTHTIAGGTIVSEAHLMRFIGRNGPVFVGPIHNGTGTNPWNNCISLPGKQGGHCNWQSLSQSAGNVNRMF